LGNLFGVPGPVMESSVRKLTKYEKILILLFLLTLPIVNPWVRGDGVGYYAFARALLVEHRLDFRADWLNSNTSFRMSHVDSQGNIYPQEFTSTGHLDNHFAIGPAILWAPFLIVVHGAVHAADATGAHIPADGFSRPYVTTMAVATAAYGFGAIWIAFHLARKYVAERWAFIAAVGVWFGSSLPVYMYFNPSWSHAQSAFMVAVFLWYWIRTLGRRSTRQWLILGAIAGLMMDVYYINVAVLLMPAAESLIAYYSAIKENQTSRIGMTLLGNAIFALALIVAFLPTLVIKKLIYGSFFDFGYRVSWYWSSPAFLKVAFSSDHGFLSWTPVLILAVAGLFLFYRRSGALAAAFVGVLLLYIYLIGCYSDWDGLASYGNRFFVSLTPIFVIGLAAFFDWLESAMQERRAAWTVGIATGGLVALNFGLIFQWGVHLIPARGPISWRKAAYNEVVVVPAMVTGMMKEYLTGRSQLMKHIEEEDVRQLKSGQSKDAP
jgi:hypothetical protein